MIFVVVDRRNILSFFLGERDLSPLTEEEKEEVMFG